MSAIRKAAAEAVAAFIATGVPDLLGNAKALQDDEEEKMKYPALRVLPARLEFIPAEEDEIETDDDASPEFVAVQLATVGEFEGDFEIRIYSLDKSQRDRLEDDVSALFLEAEGTPGVIACPMGNLVIKGRQSLYSPVVSCALDNVEWNDERVFDKKRYSFINTLVNFDVSIARGNAARIDTLLLEITGDLENTSSVADEVVQVHQDGSISVPTN